MSRIIHRCYHIIVLILCLQLASVACAGQVSYVFNAVEKANAGGPVTVLAAGDTLEPSDIIRLNNNAICEIAFDNGNTYARFDKPGEYSLTELFEDNGQNHSALDLQTRLSLKWQRLKSVLPKYSKTITLPGIRGGVIRPNVAKLQPGLKRSTFLEPFFLAGSDGKAAAIWHSQYYDDQEISFAKLLLDQPPRIIRLTKAKGLSRWPYLAGDLSGHLYAAWEDGRDSKKPEIYFKHSTDGGDTWSETKRITTHGKGTYDPVLWTDGSKVILIWEDARKGIYYKSSQDNGITWSEESQLAKGDAAWPQINGSQENLWVAWVEKKKKINRISAIRSHDGGRTWSKSKLIVKSSKSIGEPSIQALKDKGAVVTWRDSRHGASEIYTRTSLDGKSWSSGVRAAKNSKYCEYPGLIKTEEGLALVYYSSTFDKNYSWITPSVDQGMSWSEPLRIPGLTNNVGKAYFITTFELPWDRSIYANHDMTFKINGRVIGKLENSLPEGQCLFEFDPRILEYSPSGQAQNKVEFNTKRMNGGNYHINSGFKIVQSMTQQEMMVVATSQAEADKVAGALLPEQINHVLPDVGVFANKIKGLPEKRNQAGVVSLEVELFNLGAKSASNVEVYVARGERGEGTRLSKKIKISKLGAGTSRKVKLSFKYDGTLFKAAIVAHISGADSDPENNTWMFRMGYEKKGTLKVYAEEGAEIITKHQSTREEVTRFKSGDGIDLPIGVYHIAAIGPKQHIRENVAIKGGETTAIYFETQGSLLVHAPEDYPFKIYQNNEIIKKSRSNQEIKLDPGFYKIEVDYGEQSTARYQDVLIKSRQLMEVSVKMGHIGVSSLGNYPAKLYYSDGSFYRGIPGAKYVQIPSGIYQIKVKPGEFPEKDLGIVEVAENEQVKVRLTGFGQIGVASVGQWDYSLYTLKGEKFMNISGSKIFTTIIPVGTYQVKVKPEDYAEIDMGRVTVKEDEVIKLKTPGFGKFGVESPGNWDYTLFHPDGRKFKDMKGGEIFLTVVPSGTYTVKVYPDEYDSIDMGTVTIKDNENVKQRVPGYGWIGVTSLGKWDAQLFYPDGREFRTIKGDRIRYTVVPAGAYRAKINPDPYPEQDLGEYTVKAYEKADIQVKGFGQIGVESLGNWDSELYTLDGNKFCDLSVKNIYLKVVPVGKYIARLKPDPYPARELGEVLVEERKATRIKVPGYGQVLLTPRGNYTAGLYMDNGEMMREIKADSTFYTVVPVGKYTVKIGGKKVASTEVTENCKITIETGYQP